MFRLRRQLVALTLLMTLAGVTEAACPAGYPLTTPSSDFTDAGNGTVRHTPTGLVWKRCSEGQSWTGSTCTGTVASYNWADALARADAVNAGSAGTENAGQADWRLPNLKELHSIIESGCGTPAINTAQFPATPIIQEYWSSTPQAGWPFYAWAVSFGNGADGYSNVVASTYAVRLVRSGGLPTQYDISSLAAAVPAITSGAPTAGTVGIPYSFPITASGSGTITFGASGLPANLAIDTASGVISGTPNVAGSFPVTVTATNASGTTQASYTLVIAAAVAAPSITSVAPAAGTVGMPYSFAVTASGSGTITFGASGLPASLAIDAASGVISGTPNVAGSFPVTVTATNAGGTTQASYTLVIAAAVAAPSITSGAPPAGTAGTPYQFTVTASGSGTITFGASGLPTGLSINPSSGLISGTPGAAGSYPVTITATNSGGSTPANYTLTVAAAGVVGATPVPTLSQWATLALAGLLGFAGWLARRRER